MNRLVAIVIMLLLGLGVFGGFKGCQYQRTIQNLEEQVVFGKEQATFFEDELGRANGQITELKVSKSTIQRALDSLEVSGEARKNAKAVTEVDFETTKEVVADIDTIITIGDTIESNFSFDSEFMKINDGVFHYSPDTAFLTFDLKYTGEMKMVTFENKRFLRPNEIKVRAFLTDPDAIITGVSEITLKEPNKKWVFGLTAAYGASQYGLSPFIGIGITRKIFSF